MIFTRTFLKEHFLVFITTTISQTKNVTLIRKTGFQTDNLNRIYTRLTDMVSFRNLYNALYIIIVKNALRLGNFIRAIMLNQRFWEN